MAALLGPRSHARRNLHSLAARGVILTASAWTAGLQLWSTSSLAYRAGGGGEFIAAMNIIVLALCALGTVDVLLHDVGRRLLLPMISSYWRAQVCVGLYSALGLAAGARAFVAMGDLAYMLPVGAYYVALSVWSMVEAAAIAADQPHEAGAGMHGEVRHGS